MYEVPTGVQTFDLWEKRGEVHGQLVVPSLHNNLENLKDNFNFHLSPCGMKNRKKIIACSFFLQLYCGKEGKKVPCFHAGCGIPVVKNFLKACNKKLLHTHSLYRQNF